MFVSLSKSIQKDFNKGEQQSMKKKIVKEYYTESAEMFVQVTDYYKKNLITFEEMLRETADRLKTETHVIYNAWAAGLLVYDEYQLIIDRLNAFVKKEVKNACKI